ncbi:hypothetical protein ACFOLF_18590 [Paenibacillus sepulcri]|uniref:DNA polymerase III subunit beta n=1 Tax=Paenibacillus sepulcri TaxID=359917 RepID=UPI0035E5962F
MSQKLLLHALHHVAPAVSSRSIIPLLSGILLQADSQRLRLSASNTSMMLQYELPAEDNRNIVELGGSVVIPALYFIDIIRHCPSSMVTLECDNSLIVSIRSDTSVYHLSGMNAEEYPRMAGDSRSNKVSLQSSLLAGLIKKVAFAVSASEFKPILTGVSFTVEGKQLRLLATDGVRLASQVTNALQHP